MSESIFSKAIYLEDVPESQWKDHIAPGYRSVCYKTDALKNGQIILFGFDKQGNRKTFICPHKSHIYYNVKYKTEELDMYDRYVARKEFNNSYERKKYIENAAGINDLIVESLKPDQEFLHKMFDFDVLKPDFNTQSLRIQFIDIETEISEQFERPVDARNRINMITIFDNFTNKYYTWSLNHAEIDFKEEPLKDMPKDMFVFFEFNDNEKEMLLHFIDWIEANYPDVSCGYNSQAYDWPYIIRRCENVLGKVETARISPVGKYRIKEVNHDNARSNLQADIEVDIQGLFIADEMILYRDKFKVEAALDGGYKLDNVGEHEGCGHKIHYEGTLKDLYLKDYQKFYEYNVRDVDLLVRIETKCKLIPLARQIASFGLTNYNAIYSSIGYLIGSCIAFTRSEMGNKVFCSYMPKKNESTSYEGAFVFPTIPGFYDGGIATIDFASLYPSSIRAINASPETYKGKIHIFKENGSGEIVEVDEKIDFKNTSDIHHMTIELPNKIVKPITLKQLNEIIESKCIFTTNNTLFLRHEIKKGVIAEWCSHFYSLRKANKKKELEIFHKLHNTEFVKTIDAEMKNQLTIAMENFHNSQMAEKIMINSIYGCLGTAFSPIFNAHIAQSITRLGQFCNKSTAKFIEKIFIDNYGASQDYQVACGGDTDSVSGGDTVYIRCISSK